MVGYGPTLKPYAQAEDADAPYWIDCLLHYSKSGKLTGILNHYREYSEYEKPGNVNVWVKPSHRRHGIASKLVKRAIKLWEIDLRQQRYSPEGRALVEKLFGTG